MLKKMAVSALVIGAGLMLGMMVPQQAHATVPHFHQVTKCVRQGRDRQLCTVYFQSPNGELIPSYCYYLYPDGTRSPIFISPEA